VINHVNEVAYFKFLITSVYFQE